MNRTSQLVKIILFSCISILALLQVINAPLALFIGFIFTSLLGNPLEKLSKKLVAILLKIAVIGLGFGMSVQKTLEVGKEGFLLTFLSISVTLLLGIYLGKLLKINKVITYLIANGTAICGGSAIAAISSVIKAKEEEISIGLGVIFFLNALAIFIFPSIGDFFNLSQEQFGLWCAIAIHDTSSVVGAAMTYGKEALNLAITVKLARALWIIPVSFLSMLLFKSKNEKLKIPWFIIGFIITVVLNSYVNLPIFITDGIPRLSKSIMVLTLFLIGTGLSVTSIKKSGIKPILLGIVLWLVISVGSLCFIL